MTPGCNAPRAAASKRLLLQYAIKTPPLTVHPPAVRLLHSPASSAVSTGHGCTHTTTPPSRLLSTSLHLRLKDHDPEVIDTSGTTGLTDPVVKKGALGRIRAKAQHVQRKQAALESEQGGGSRFNWKEVLKRIQALTPNGQSHPVTIQADSTVAQAALDLLHGNFLSSIEDDSKVSATLERTELQDSTSASATLQDLTIDAMNVIHNDAERTIRTDSNYKDGVSLEGYETVIESLLTQNLLPDARRVLRRLLLEGPDPSTATFNLFLRDSAERRNLQAFNVYIGAMARMGVNADAGSWAALYEIVASPRAKQVIALDMHNRGFLQHKNSVRAVGRTIVSYSFGRFLDGGGRIEDYIKTLDSLCGPSWLGGPAAHRMLYCLGERGRIVDAVRLVDEFITVRSYAPTALDLTVLLGHCALYRAVDTAVKVTLISLARWNVELDNVAYETLFQICWETHQYNVARVVWRYACYSGRTTYKMRTRVYRSLVENLTHTKLSGTPAYDDWKKNAGSIIVKQTRTQVGRKGIFQVLRQQRRLVKRRPLSTLASKLKAAMMLDNQWARDRLRNSTDALWKLKNVITIPHARSTHRQVVSVRLDVQAERYRALVRWRTIQRTAHRMGSSPPSFGRPRRVASRRHATRIIPK